MKKIILILAMLTFVLSCSKGQNSDSANSQNPSNPVNPTDSGGTKRLYKVVKESYWENSVCASGEPCSNVPENIAVIRLNDYDSQGNLKRIIIKNGQNPADGVAFIPTDDKTLGDFKMQAVKNCSITDTGAICDDPVDFPKGFERYIRVDGNGFITQVFAFQDGAKNTKINYVVDNTGIVTKSELCDLITNVCTQTCTTNTLVNDCSGGVGMATEITSSSYTSGSPATYYMRSLKIKEGSGEKIYTGKIYVKEFVR